MENLQTLKRIALGEAFTDIDLEFDFIVDDERKRLVLASLLTGDAHGIRITANKEWQSLLVFGERVGTGPLSLEASGITVLSLEETRAAFYRGTNGTTVPIKLHCDGDCRFTANKHGGDLHSHPEIKIEILNKSTHSITLPKEDP